MLLPRKKKNLILHLPSEFVTLFLKHVFEPSMLAQVCKLSSLQEVKVEKFHELKVILGYTMSSRPAWTTYNVLLLLKKQNKQIGKNHVYFLLQKQEIWKLPFQCWTHPTPYLTVSHWPCLCSWELYRSVFNFPPHLHEVRVSGIFSQFSISQTFCFHVQFL